MGRYLGSLPSRRHDRRDQPEDVLLDPWSLPLLSPTRLSGARPAVFILLPLSP